MSDRINEKELGQPLLRPEPVEMERAGVSTPAAQAVPQVAANRSGFFGLQCQPMTCIGGTVAGAIGSLAGGFMCGVGGVLGVGGASAAVGAFVGSKPENSLSEPASTPPVARV